MREAETDLQDRGVAVAVVTFDHGPLAEAYVEDTGLRWPLLLDRDRSLYHVYGMMHSRTADLIGPSALLLYFKLLLRGRRLRPAGSDLHQRGGDVLIDPSGIVRLHHVGTGPADRPDVRSLLALASPEGPA